MVIYFQKIVNRPFFYPVRMFEKNFLAILYLLSPVPMAILSFLKLLNKSADFYLTNSNPECIIDLL
jgi:hypothetical protein